MKIIEAVIIGLYRQGATLWEICGIVNSGRDFKVLFEEYDIEKVIYDYRLKNFIK